MHLFFQPGRSTVTKNLLFRSAVLFDLMCVFFLSIPGAGIKDLSAPQKEGKIKKLEKGLTNLGKAIVGM